MKTIGIVVGSAIRREGRSTLTARSASTSRLYSLADKFRKALASTLGPSLHQSNILAVDVTVFAHPLAECIKNAGL